MLHKLLLVIALCAPFFCGSALANDMVKWTDEDGAVHFGNAQFAPAGAGEPVALHPANRMDVPNLGILHQRASRQKLNIVMIKRVHMKNPRGWRGYQSRRGGRSGRSSRL
jgi:hypothetical protein